jgi:hypothetical protein
MTVTVRDLITTAFLKLGILGVGEALDASYAATGLRCLNSLLDAWALEDLLVYVIDRQVFPLVANTQTYTLGPGGTWNTTPLYGAGSPRPAQIEGAWWQEPSTLIEQPIHVLKNHVDYQYFRSIPTITSTLVTDLWYDAGAPLGTVFVYPKPTAASNIILYLWHPWNAATTLATTLTLAPGYQRLLEFNLPVELSSEFPGTLRPDIVALANESMEKAQRRNVRVPRMASDLAGVTSHSGHGRHSMWGFTDWATGGE